MTSCRLLPLLPTVPLLAELFLPPASPLYPQETWLGHQPMLCGLALGEGLGGHCGEEGWTLSWLQGGGGDDMLGRLFYPKLLAPQKVACYMSLLD